MEPREVKLYKVSVKFPYEPYAAQQAVGWRVVKSLVQRSKATLIESSTGTGKTLAVLSPVLAWAKTAREASGVTVTDESIKNTIMADSRKTQFCYCIKEEPFEQVRQSSLLNAAYVCRNCQEDFSSTEGRESEYFGNDVLPQIYYCSRTHRQIDQVVEQLKTTAYCDDVKMTILSSRQRTCINDELIAGTSVGIDEACRRLTASRPTRQGSRAQTSANPAGGCRYYRDLLIMPESFDSFGHQGQSVFSIEDLVQHGRAKSLCPYYGAKSLLPYADLVLCTYNHILDPTIRHQTGLSTRNSILIFDEGHNIDGICRELGTFEVSASELELLDKNLCTLREQCSGDDETTRCVNIMSKLCLNLSNFIATFTMPADGGDGGNTNVILSQSRVRDALNEMGIDINFVAQLRLAERTVSNFCHLTATSAKNKPGIVATSKLSTNNYQLISQFINTFDMMTWNDCTDMDCFKMIMSKPVSSVQTRSSFASASVAKLTVVCVDASVVFKQVQEQSWATIILSGTLSPLDHYDFELGLGTSQKLTTAHTVGEDRFRAFMLTMGPGNIRLDCRHAQKDNESIIDSIGRILLDVCKCSPAGVLCFFVSYDRLDLYYRRWSQTGLLGQIMNSTRKAIYRETSKESDISFKATLTSHTRDSSGKGSLLLAVMKGKYSEGVDMPGSCARAVITIGIPFPPVQDIKVKAKMQYNRDFSSTGGTSTSRRPVGGSKWLEVQAYVPLSQAIGRCIRGNHDWGAAVLIDSRFDGHEWKEYLPRWIQRNVALVKDYDKEFRRPIGDFMDKDRC